METKTKILKSLLFPYILVLIMWAVEYIGINYDIDFTGYGIIPRAKEGLLGIITSPFVHANYSHLISNTLPLFLMCWAMFYFYDEIALKIFVLIFFMTDIFVWIMARDASHIGASGLVYGVGAFLFSSGVIRKETKLMAISMLVIFLYGGMVWGIFPNFYPQNISWEAHMMGALAGIVNAVIFRKQGPQRQKYDWEDEDENDDVNSEEKDNFSE